MRKPITLTLIGIFGLIMLSNLTFADVSNTQILGNANIGAYYDCNGSNRDNIYGQIYTAPSNGTIKSMSMYVASLSTGNWNLTLGIYNVSSSIPTTLLGQESTVMTPDSWNTVYFSSSSTANIIGGQQYYLAFMYSENNGSVSWCTYVNQTSITSYQVFYGYTDDLPVNYPGVGCACNNERYSLYADYIPSPNYIASSTLSNYQSITLNTIIADIETGTIIGLLLGFAIVVMRKNN